MFFLKIERPCEVIRGASLIRAISYQQTAESRWFTGSDNL